MIKIRLYYPTSIHESASLEIHLFLSGVQIVNFHVLFSDKWLTAAIHMSHECYWDIQLMHAEIAYKYLLLPED